MSAADPDGVPVPRARWRAARLAEAALPPAAGAGLAMAAASFAGPWVGLAVAAAVGGAAAWRARVTQAPLEALAERLAACSERAGSGGRLELLDPDAYGHYAPLAARTNDMLRAVAANAAPSRARIASVRALPDALQHSLKTIATSSEDQEGAVEEVASLMANINRSIEEINGRVERLSEAAEDSSSSILEMSTANDEVARNAGSLSESVETCASAVEQMRSSIRQVAEGADHVQRVAEDTAASVFEMDRSVSEVSDHVQEAAALTTRVSRGAEAGSEAVAATIADIGSIDGLTRDARDVIERLAARIAEISNILEVMGDINDETNLLALNAAIIAAQAGEQGKAFLVVANHVKTLAQRTASSTQDIAGLIEAVQQESDNAVEAMGAGIGAIAQGVARSRAAGEALETIRGSAHDASSRVAEIARASEEQARNSKLVADAAQETSSQIQQITSAIIEQLRASDQMAEASDSALGMCRQVARSTHEQRETGRYIAASIASINEMIRDIQSNTDTHARASAAVSNSVHHLLHNAHESRAELPQLQQLVASVRDDLDAIAAQLDRCEFPPEAATRRAGRSPASLSGASP